MLYMKNEFISSVSHELRTPLTAIRGWGETLLDDVGSEKKTRQKGLNVIINDTSRLSSIVEDLLDFSKMQSGRFTIKKEKMDILAELEEAIITSGGINTKEIRPGTMESKLHKGLYFAGEVIDVDAYTGGFNLQIAWSTGYAAGMAIKNCSPEPRKLIANA